jgi:NhaA family Na+:H+ antiporter
MTPVSSVLSRSALALLAGILLATLAVNLFPQGYYDLTEWRLADLGLPGRSPRAITPMLVVSDVLMAAFVFLLGKELWEALTRERGGFAGQAALAPGLMVAGGLLLPAAMWPLLSVLAGAGVQAGWPVPLGGDTALAYLVGRRMFGAGHASLQLLLFVCIGSDIAALLVSGLAAPRGDGLQPLWLGLPLAAASFGWLLLTRRAADPLASERAKSRALAPWPWVAPALLCWLGVAASGLPPALGLLPLLPAMPRAAHSFGLFAVAESFLTDPANRIARVLRPALPAILFLFGLTHGALDLGAAGDTTVVTALALWLGKPLGILAGAVAAQALFGRKLAPGRDLPVIAALGALSFTAPALTLATTLPAGAEAEAARLGLGPGLVVAGLVWLALSRRPALRR